MIFSKILSDPKGRLGASMGYALTYLVHMKGTASNDVMRPSHRASSHYLRALARQQEADLWDGMLPGDDSEFLVDLSGQWTLLKLPYAYSSVIGSAELSTAAGNVERFEQALQQLLHSTETFRVDDFLIDKWNWQFDYLLVRYESAVHELIEWLKSQDRRYWAKLPGG